MGDCPQQSRGLSPKPLREERARNFESLLVWKRPMKRNTDQAPPKGFSLMARRWWKRLLADFSISDAAGLLLLETALRCFDRAERARDRKSVV